MLTPGHATAQDALTRRERLSAVALLLPREGESPAALQQFVAHVAAVLRAPSAGVSLILSDAGIIPAAHGVGGWLAEAGGMPAEWAPCATVVRGDAPLLITDTYDDPAHVTNPLVTISGVRSYAGAPLRLRGQPVGALWVLSGEPDRHTHDDLDALAGLAPRAVELLRGACGD
ncbi:GAF domain-containing protein [Actinoplanes siamensis]|uniref:GAF domain-containing protein n=1 Tax=Actinoplanes siamensis TaxID=1223317 RepID=A0A919KA02_9ACTN|nr:GAF domain-containing protein [Actinoplanes siamensis]GIF02540.1 hypothetical protein Asi03nite_00780 [Actinoplanes siamensis]